MVKANELIKEQQERDKIKIQTFKKVYKRLEKKIVFASSSNYYYVWYEIPEFILGLPTYNLDECIEYLINELIKNQFSYDLYKPNILLIKWFPKD